ncbi:cell envelope biogenesis protein OmpA [Bradyrhizobium centrolobii]|uniref:Cell envelope biogenesis protein OmpA n=1 Tax=Bradyrhizobium centrolobii TaxID=1505087 RepID=A0A176YFC8_9BRAD|nr:outer membrane beta-barrel protein [Bradyrhizobium centrolobii]OAF05026.1 cell envelope biogenesis protein OmpA [Bradyrhizobium centrolobii]
MRSVKSLLAAGAATLISSVAFAADMPIAAPPPMYAPAPPADFGGWYLRGDIGFSNQSIKKRDYYSYPTLLSLNQQNGFDTAGIFGVGVGYRFNNWFRADVTGQYRGNANFHGFDRTSYTDTGTVQYGSDTYSASKSEILLLANAYVDLGTWWCVTPFIGAGIGASRNTISNFTDHGVNGTAAFGSVPGFASATSASKWNFAWALHTGLAYQISPNVTLELGYSYVNLGDAVTGELVNKDGVGAGQNHVMTFKDITSHDLKLGVRWNLDSPPVYAPPPLVTKG